MEYLANPAERLYEILSLARKTASTGEMINVKEVWVEVLGINVDNDTQVFSALVKLVSLTESIKKEIEKAKNKQKEYLVGELTKIEKSLMNLHLSNNAIDICHEITASNLQALQSCAVILDFIFDYKEITEEQLESIRRDINELINEILNSDLENEFKGFILKGLREIEYAINSYKISGLEGLKSLINENVGGILLNTRLVQSTRDSNNKNIKEMVEKVIKTFYSINTIITFTDNLKPLIGELGKIFIK